MMLRLASCALPHSKYVVAPCQLQVVRTPGQLRSFGLFSDLKNQLKSELEQNVELKKSFEELKHTREQFEHVKKVATDKVSAVGSVTGEAARSFQQQASEASKKLKESHYGTAEAGHKEDEAGRRYDSEKSMGGGAEDEAKRAEADSETNESVENARTFLKNFFTGIAAQKNKVVHSSSFSKLRDEWKEAAQELFGKKEKQTVDEALASVRTPATQKTKKAENDGEGPAAYTGTSALVAVKESDSAWQRVSARFREAPIIKGILDAAKQAAKTDAGKKVQLTTKKVKDKLNDAQEEVLEVWETSQNPWVYRLSSIYDGLFGETPMGVAIKEIRRAEPDFILEEWKENIEKVVLPGVLEAFLRGNSRDLKKWFGEAAYSRVNIAIRERKSEGLVMDPHVLSIDNVEVIEATAEDKQAPIVLMRFQAQQINCNRNRGGEVVEGTEDEVLAYYYIFAFQREYDEELESLRWRIVDLHMQRGGRYY